MFALRLIRPILWMALYLAIIEITLEYRSARRGWRTLLFSPPAAVSIQTPAGGESGKVAFGPTDQFPFRSRIIPPAKPPGTLRYWIASSSHAEDRNLGAEEIFPTRLERLLQSNGAPAQVLNASRAGQTLEGHLALVADLGPRWSPDVVVLYQMSNDISLLCKQARNRGGEPAGASGDPGLPWRWADRSLENTSLWPLLKTNLTSMLTAQRLLHDELGEDAERRYEQNVRRFVRAWKSAGASVALCTFAISHDERGRSRIPLQTIQTIFRHNSHLSIEGWIATVHNLNDRIRNVAAEENCPLIDLEKIVGGRSDLFRDFVHFTAAGHRQVARSIAEVLLHPQTASLPPGSGVK